jgi:hypothetical protein
VSKLCFEGDFLDVIRNVGSESVERSLGISWMMAGTRKNDVIFAVERFRRNAQTSVRMMGSNVKIMVTF